MSKEEKTDNLINDLCGDLQPQKRSCPYRQIFLWGILSIIYIVSLVFYFGIAVNLSDYVSRATFIFEAGLVTAIFISAALASSWLNLPDGMQRNWIKVIATTLFSVFIFWIAANTLEEAIREGIVMGKDFFISSCSRGLVAEIVPFLVLVYLGARGRTTQPYWTITMNVMAVSAIGWLGLRITCPMYENMTYSFVHYLLPFCILGAGIGFFSRKIFKW